MAVALQVRVQRTLGDSVQRCRQERVGEVSEGEVLCRENGKTNTDRQRPKRPPSKHPPMGHKQLSLTRGGFIQKRHLWLVVQQARKRYALLLPQRQHVRPVRLRIQAAHPARQGSADGADRMSAI